MTGPHEAPTPSATLPYFSAADVARRLPFPRAMDAIERALRDGLNPELDGPRLFADFPGGEFLLMPAQGAAYSGVKALTIAPGNPARGLEKIQGLYLLYSSDTAAPIAVLEGASLTAIRTPAVAISAVRQLAAAAPAGDQLPERPRVLVFGAGVQAAGHLRAAATAFPGATFDVIGRRPERVSTMIEALARADETATSTIVNRGSDVDAAVPEADIILCTTTASTPLFDGSLVKPGAIVAATGTHGTELREVDDALVSRADIVVEGRASAQRENGNLATLLTRADWEGPNAPGNLQDLARGRVTRSPGRPALYTGVGMSWEDLICATAVLTASAAHRIRPEETR